MNEITSFAAWAGLFGALVAVTPRLIAAVTRRKEVDVKSELDRFDALFDEQRQQLVDCRAQCDRLHEAREADRRRFAEELMHERAERVTEREWLVKELTEARTQVRELLGMMHRMGFKDPRQHKRVNGESA